MNILFMPLHAAASINARRTFGSCVAIDDLGGTPGAPGPGRTLHALCTLTPHTQKVKEKSTARALSPTDESHRNPRAQQTAVYGIACNIF